MTKIAIFSDSHGYLPKIPKCDLVICAGDSIPCTQAFHDLNLQRMWFESEFNSWAKDLTAPVIFIAGNHDRCYDFSSRPYVPRAVYLQDNFIKAGNLKIWGSPYSLPFGKGWAFNRTEEQLTKIYEKIPADVDVIVSHGPPYGFGDKAYRDKDSFEHTGSRELLKTIDRVKPKLLTTGHIHEAAGLYQYGDTTIINFSLRNERYQLVREPIVVEI